MVLCRRVAITMMVFFVVCFFTSAFAGNKKMVVKRTEEMDDQNKQMVGQIPNLPKNGKVDAKARVVNEGGSLVFDIYHVKTSVKEESLDFSGKQKNKNSKEELIPDPVKSTDISGSDNKYHEAETKSASNYGVQEENESLNNAVERKQEDISKELYSDPEKDIEISVSNDEQQAVTNNNVSASDPEAKDNNINLNGEQPEVVLKDTVVNDDIKVQKKSEAAKSMSIVTE